MSITQSIVAIVTEAAAGRRVIRVDVDIGKLSGILSQSVAFCFDAISKDTPLDGAVLNIRDIEGRSRCRACDGEVDTPTLFTACACGSRDLERLSGEELKIRSMEIEEAA